MLNDVFSTSMNVLMCHILVHVITLACEVASKFGGIAS